MPEGACSHKNDRKCKRSMAMGETKWNPEQVWKNAVLLVSAAKKDLMQMMRYGYNKFIALNGILELLCYFLKIL